MKTSLTSIQRILANVDIKTGIQLCQVKVEIEKEYMQSDVIMGFFGAFNNKLFTCITFYRFILKISLIFQSKFKTFNNETVLHHIHIYQIIYTHSSKFII